MPGKTTKPSIAALALLAALSAPLFGAGKAEAEADALNPEWALCLAAPDVSALPPAQRVVGDLLVRSLAKSLGALHHRIRVSEEYAYYRDSAYVRALSDAGKKLGAKRSERDLLVFKGYPDWRYKSELKAIDAAIKTLEEEYQKAEEAVLKVSVEPAFKLVQENADGAFPAPPAAGGEYKYCVAKKADAFVSSEVSEFHGRLSVRVRMYTLYTRSYEYEDSFIFSTDDLGLAQEEMLGRLTAAISGASPAAIAVKTDPADAVILVKESYAGQGDTGIREYAPGPVDVTVFADGYEGQSVSVDLAMGELTDLDFKLRPVPQASFGVSFPGHEGAPVYQGSLYIGGAPLALSAPLDQAEYIHAEIPGGGSSAVVFRAGQTGSVVTLPLAPSTGKDPTPLGTARRRYYGAWTAFWISLPVAFVLNGVSSSYQNAWAVGGDPEVGKTYQIMSAVSTGAWIGFGTVAAYSLYRIFRYNITASKSAPRVAK